MDDITVDTDLTPEELDRESSSSYNKEDSTVHGWRKSLLAETLTHEEETLLKYDPPLAREKSPPAQMSSGDVDAVVVVPEDDMGDLEHFEIKKIHEEAMTNIIKSNEKLRICINRSLRNDELDNLLNRIQPPQDWVENGVQYVRHISRTVATTADVKVLENRLDSLLESRLSLPEGICPIRRALYEDCFDEIIRQVALVVPERALALLRCREEFLVTIRRYCRLFEGTVSFCLRKTLKHSSALLKKNLKILREEVQTCQKIAQKLEHEHDHNTVAYAEEIDRTHKKHSENLEYLKLTNFRLKRQLEAITSPMKHLGKSEGTGTIDGTVSRRASKQRGKSSAGLPPGEAPGADAIEMGAL